MVMLVFIVLMFLVFGKILGFAFKAAWGVTKIICTVVLLPLFLLGLVLQGLIAVALPLLLVVGIISLFLPKSSGARI